MLFKRLNHPFWSQIEDTTLPWGTCEKAMEAAKRDNTLRYNPTTKGRDAQCGKKMTNVQKGETILMAKRKVSSYVNCHLSNQ